MSLSGPRVNAASDIDAPIDVVWSVVLDLRRYAEWNPFVYRAECDGDQPAVGSRLALHVAWVSGGRVRANVEIMRITPPGGSPSHAALVYDYRGPLHVMHLVRSRRTQTLEALPDGRTRYTTEEFFAGLVAWAVPARKVKAGFEAHAAALKARAESLHQARPPR